MKLFAALILGLTTALPASVVACGWWGENLEDQNTEAVVVENGSDTPDLSTPEGMAHMARAYRTGDGVPQDDLVARRWTSLAAKAGHVGAMNDYGQMLEMGIGGPQDLAGAADWYRRATAGGNPNAMHSLAHMYFDGRGVPVDTARGVELMRQSAASGHLSAAAELAEMLWRGDFAEQEPGEACLWWLVADLGAASDRARDCQQHDARMTPAQIKGLGRRAAEILSHAGSAAGS